VPRAMQRVLSFLLLIGQAAAAAAQSQPFTLDQALSLAQKNSEAIRLSHLALEKSQAALGEARGKAFPHLDLEASGS